MSEFKKIMDSKLKGKPQFAVWEEENPADGGGYWNLFEKLEDAVSCTSHSPVEVYKMEPVRLGTYQRSVIIVKTKKAKKK